MSWWMWLVWYGVAAMFALLFWSHARAYDRWVNTETKLHFVSRRVDMLERWVRELNGDDLCDE